MQQHGVDCQVGENIQVGERMGDNQLIASTPHATGKKLTAIMDLSFARILHGVVGIAQRRIAVAVEAVAGARLVQDQ